MTNYDQIKEILKQFSDKYVTKIIIESKMSAVSEDKAASKNTEEKVLLYEDSRKDMQVIDMDEIAHNAYRIARYPESVKEDDSLASADAFVINADNMWYFIEFKNQEITKAKNSVTKKAYQNWYWLVDVLREMKDQIQYNNFNYEDPKLIFAKMPTEQELSARDTMNGSSALRIFITNSIRVEIMPDCPQELLHILIRSLKENA